MSCCKTSATKIKTTNTTLSTPRTQVAAQTSGAISSQLGVTDYFTAQPGRVAPNIPQSAEHTNLTNAQINAVLSDTTKSDQDKLKYFLSQKSQNGFIQFLNKLSKETRISTYKECGNNMAHIAAAHDFHGVIDALKTFGVDLENKNDYDEMPLHTAIRYGSLNYIKAYMKKIARLNTTIRIFHDNPALDLDPLSYAILYNQWEVVNYFLGKNEKNDDNVNIGQLGINNNLEKWFDLAVSLNHYDLLGGLILNPKVAEVLDKYPNVPALAFCTAAKLCNTKVLKLLAARFPQVANNPLSNYMPLHYAVDSSESETDIIATLECLLRLGVDINGRDVNSTTVGEVVTSRVRQANPDPKYGAIDNFLKISSVELQTRQHKRIEYKPENLDTLVFSGGGAKGVSYVGVLEKYAELTSSAGLLTIRRVAGTSAGAIVASLIAVGIDSTKLRELMLSTQIMKFIDEEAVQQLLTKNESSSGSFGKFINFLVGYAKEKVKLTKDGTFTNTIRNLKKKHGLCDGSAFLRWITRCIEDQIKQVTGGKYSGENLTFGKLHGLKQVYPQLKELHIAVTDISGKEPKPKIFSSEDERCSNVIIAHVVRASMSIPGLFTPCAEYIQHNGRSQEMSNTYYVDGGLIYNNPVSMFDYLEYQIANASTSEKKYKQFNEKVIGFVLTSRRTEASHESEVKLTKTSYLDRLTALYMNAEESLTNSDERSKDRLVYVDCGDVTTVSFDLTPEQQDQIIAAGSNAIAGKFANSGSEQLQQAPAEKEFATIAKQVITDENQLKLAPPPDLAVVFRRSPRPSESGSCSKERSTVMSNCGSPLHETGSSPTYFSRGVSSSYESPIRSSGGSFNNKVHREQASSDRSNTRITNINAAYGCYVEPHWYNVVGDKIKNLKINNQSGTPIRFAITGIPGSGKTQLAKYYANTYTDTSHIVWIIVADTPENLWRSYHLLAQELKVDTNILQYETAEAWQNRVCINVSRYLEQNLEWLLIFDNVKEFSVIEKFMPTKCCGNGTILITTRNKHFFQDSANLQDIDRGLNMPEALNLLEKATGIKITTANRLKAEELAKELEFLPLNLAVAGANIQGRNRHMPNCKYSYEEYKTHLQNLSIEQIEEEQKQGLIQLPDDYGRTQYMVIRDAFTQLGQKARELLEFCSYLFPNEIGMELLENFVGISEPSLSKNDLNANMKQLLSEIKKSSLLYEIPGKSAYDIHRVTKKVIRRCCANCTTTVANNILQSIYRPFINIGDVGDIVENPKRWQPLLPHMTIIAENELFLRSVDTIHVARLLYYIGLMHLASVNAKEAIKYLTEALDIQQACKADSVEIANTKCNLAAAYYYLGQQKQQAKLVEEILPILEKEHDRGDAKKDAYYLYAVDVSASAYLSDYPKQAVDWLLFLLPQVERVYKDNPRSVAWRRAHIENSLGFALYMESNGLDNLEKAKRLEEAKVHLERALESHEHIFGTDDWRITDNLNNLGNVCRDSKELVRAKELLTRALTIREARYGVDHPEVAETLDGLGKTYIDLGKLETAKQMLTRSLIIKQNHYDAENRELAKTYHYQGKADLALGNTTAARESLQKALQIRLQHYDASHWLVIKIQQDLDAFQCKQ